MKVALLLLFCLVSMSAQQRFFFGPIPFNPRFNYFPFLYGSNYPIAAYSNDQVSENQSEEQDESLLGRAKTDLQPQKKFLFASPFNFGAGFGNPFFPVFATTTSTLISWTTVPGTVTTASVIFCIVGASFSSTAQGGQTILATNPCGRRKRAAMLDMIESIEPSESQPLETSVLPEIVEKIEEPQLTSSKDDQIEDQPKLISRRTGRAATIYNTFYVTLTSTATSYSFYSTTFKKTLNLGSSLLCLPANFTVC